MKLWISRDHNSELYEIWDSKPVSNNTNGIWVPGSTETYYTELPAEFIPAIDALKLQPGECRGPLEWQGAALVPVVEVRRATLAVEYIEHDGSPASAAVIKQAFGLDVSLTPPAVYLRTPNGRIEGYDLDYFRQNYVPVSATETAR